MTAGNGLSCMICRHAASYFAGPSSASYSHCWMFSPAGHALLHGGRLCTYTGRSVRQAPVWLARLDPTSRVIVNGLSMVTVLPALPGCGRIGGQCGLGTPVWA